MIGVQSDGCSRLRGALSITHADSASTSEGHKVLEVDVMAAVDKQLGAGARPARVYFVGLLPGTHSGRLLRRDTGHFGDCSPRELTTIEDSTSLQQIKSALFA